MTKKEWLRNTIHYWMRLSEPTYYPTQYTIEDILRYRCFMKYRYAKQAIAKYYRDIEHKDKYPKYNIF